MKLPKGFQVLSEPEPKPLERVSAPSLIRLSELPNRSSLYISQALEAAIKTSEFLRDHNTQEVDIFVYPKSKEATFSISIIGRNLRDYEQSKGGLDKISIETANNHYRYLIDFAAIRAIYHLINLLPPSALESVTVSIPGLYPEPRQITKFYDELIKDHPNRIADYIQEKDLQQKKAGERATFKKGAILSMCSDFKYPAPISYSEEMPKELPKCVVYGGWRKLEKPERLYFQWFGSKDTAISEINNAFPNSTEKQGSKFDFEISDIYAHELEEAIKASKENFEIYSMDYTNISINRAGGEDYLTVTATDPKSRKRFRDGILLNNPLKIIRKLGEDGILACALIYVHFEFLKEFIRRTPPEADNLPVYLPPLFGNQKMSLKEAYKKLYELSFEALAALATDDSVRNPDEAMLPRSATVYTRKINGLFDVEDPRAESRTERDFTLYGGWVHEVDIDDIRGKKIPTKIWVFRWFTNGDEALAAINASFGDSSSSSASESHTLTYKIKVDDLMLSRYRKFLEINNLERFDFVKEIESLPTELEKLVEKSAELREYASSQIASFWNNPSLESFGDIVSTVDTLSFIRSFISNRGSKLTKDEIIKLREASNLYEEFFEEFYSRGEGGVDRFKALSLHKQSEKLRDEICKLNKIATTKLISSKVNFANPSFEDYVNFVLQDDKYFSDWNETLGAFDETDSGAILSELMGQLGFKSPISSSSIDIFASLFRDSIELSQDKSKHQTILSSFDLELKRIESVEKVSDISVNDYLKVMFIVEFSRLLDGAKAEEILRRGNIIAQRLSQAENSSLKELKSKTPNEETFDHENASRDDKRFSHYFKAYDKWNNLKTKQDAGRSVSNLVKFSIEGASRFIDAYELTS